MTFVGLLYIKGICNSGKEICLICHETKILEPREIDRHKRKDGDNEKKVKD